MDRMLRTAGLAAVFASVFAITAWAQAAGGHAHTAPHGGEVVVAADHHVEFKADPSGTISVWLLDAKEKAVAPPARGTVTLMPEGGEQVTLPLTPDPASQALVGRFDASKLKAFQAVVSLPIEGKRHNFRFRYPSHH